MNYIIPYSALKKSLKIVSKNGQLRIDMSYDEFADLLKHFLSLVQVDEQWYRHVYPDVAEAIDDGTYRSARHHFISNGYAEGRRPFPMKVDERWYLDTYPDVLEGIEDGLFTSADEHFTRHGYEEGRRPAPVE